MEDYGTEWPIGAYYADVPLRNYSLNELKGKSRQQKFPRRQH